MISTKNEIFNLFFTMPKKLVLLFLFLSLLPSTSFAYKLEFNGDFLLFREAKTKQPVLIVHDSLVYKGNAMGRIAFKHSPYPAKLKEYKFFNIGTKTYLVHEGSGPVLEYRNDSIVRIDNSFLYRNQFGAMQFVYDNEIYFYDGDGLFTFKNSIIFLILIVALCVIWLICRKKTMNKLQPFEWILYNQQKEFFLYKNKAVTVFACILTIITINFTLAMANLWLYNDQSIFLHRASGALLFVSLLYVGMNMVILFFPHLLYGLSLDLKLESTGSASSTIAETNPLPFEEADYTSQGLAPMQLAKSELQLFTLEYQNTVEAVVKRFKKRKEYLNPNFSLNQISKESGIPAHHLTYFFNDIKKMSFTDWRNNLRIAEAKILIGQGESDNFTLKSISLRSGFSSQNTFIRAFKNATGTTPSIYLKSVSSKGLFVAKNKIRR